MDEPEVINPGFQFIKYSNIDYLIVDCFFL